MARTTLLWLRRDLRLGDHPAMSAAIARGGPVIPVFLLDLETEAEGGAAPRWRLSRSLAALASDLEAIGGRLILKRGPALETLTALIAETDADAVYWSRRYDPASIARDSAVKAALKERGLDAKSFPGFVLHEPHAVATKSGGFFKVYTPFSRACFAREAAEAPLPPPGAWPAPDTWPESLALGALGLEDGMRRGAAVLADFAAPGEAAAEARLEAFLETGLVGYAERRDRLDLADGTSQLSEHLALGEISPRRAWTAARAASARLPGAEHGAETFLKELLWRDFAWHLAYHTPHLLTDNWRSEWDKFPWRDDDPMIDRWRRGRTGVPIIDAAMRELYVTGRMHNRARMLVASYLTKNLLIHWRVGDAWFRDCLIDWDPASNAMGWQWAAGSGPDAAPFFRIFNPETQAAKFDPDGAYVARWLPEQAQGRAGGDGIRFFEACPLSWRLDPTDRYPMPAISLPEGRKRALSAYDLLKSD